MPRNQLIQHRKGTASQWTAANPVLASGEPGFESDTGKQKIGDGVKAWVDLPYFLNEVDVAAMIEAALADFDGGELDYFSAAFAQPSPADVPTVTVVPYVLGAGEQLIREARASTNGPVDLAGDPHFRYDGMLTMPATSAGSSQASYANTGYLTGGDQNGQNAKYQTRIQTITSPVDRLKIRIRPPATSAAFRIKVNGSWITVPVMRFADLAAGTSHMIQLEWATKASRHIEWEESGGTGFGGMVVPLGATLTRPAEPSKAIRLAVLGDSYAGGAGQAPGGAGRMDTWCNFVAKLMGATSFINFGIGGTGYVATTTPFSTRVADIVAYNPTHIIVLGSRNDGGGASSSIQSAVAAVLSALKSGCPNANIYVSGPSTSGFAGNNSSVKAAASAAGVPFLDGIAGEWITNADLGGPSDTGSDGTNVHPTLAGHKKIARGVFEALRAAGERALVYTPAPDVGDDFNRADATALGTSSIGAATWISAGTGTRGIESNRALTTTTTASLAYSLLSAAVTGTWDWDVPVVSGARLIFNYSGGNDHFRVYESAGSWLLQRRTAADGNVVVATLAAAANGDHVSVTRATNNTLTIKVNGTQVYSAVDAANASGTQFGIAGSNASTTARYDNVTHSPLP